MKQHFERYFELFPIIMIILIMLFNEHRSERRLAPVRTSFDYAIPVGEPSVPRILLR